MERRDKENYYLDIAETVAERGTCLRRNFGAIIVNKDQIISTGYVGAPRGRRNCIDLGYCVRESLQIPRGERYELCQLRSCGGQRYHPCFQKRYSGRHVISGRQKCGGQFLCGECRALFHVQAYDHQRRHCPGDHTQHKGLVHFRQRRRLDL